LDPGHRATTVALAALPTGLPQTAGTPSVRPCDARLFICSRCGRFAMSVNDVEFLAAPTDHLDDAGRALRNNVFYAQYRLQALLYEHASQKLPTPWLQLFRRPYWPVQADEPLVQLHIDEFLARWPKGVGETLDRILCNLGRSPSSPGMPYRLGPRDFSADNCLPALFAQMAHEAKYYLQALAEQGLILDYPAQQEVLLTPAGWARIEELQRGRSSPQKPAFVAMWFGDNERAETTAFMADVYEQHLKPAIEKAGYRAERADLMPHNDFVMDKVLGMIRVAPFVVADFTGNRNGVYFEAGFARGREIHVIHSCRRSHFEQAHFDIKQINTIVWDTPEQLAEALYHRIVGTLGPGPFAGSTEGERRA